MYTLKQVILKHRSWNMMSFTLNCMGTVMCMQSACESFRLLHERLCCGGLLTVVVLRIMKLRG